MESQIIRPGFLTAHQTAGALGISLGGVRKLVQRGQLTHAGGTVGQRWYDAQAVAELAAKKATAKAA